MNPNQIQKSEILIGYNFDESQPNTKIRDPCRIEFFMNPNQIQKLEILVGLNFHESQPNIKIRDHCRIKF